MNVYFKSFLVAGTIVALALSAFFVLDVSRKPSKIDWSLRKCLFEDKVIPCSEVK